MLLLQFASGPAYWYLAFKNYLVASGVRPRVTFFFFRDTNLTDTGGWLFFRETNPQFLFRFLTLSPFDTRPQEREIAMYLLMSTLTWTIPLVLDDLVALWRERTPYWRPLHSWRPVPRLAAEAAAVGVFFTLVLALRSRVSLDFIYFQF